MYLALFLGGPSCLISWKKMLALCMHVCIYACVQMIHGFLPILPLVGVVMLFYRGFVLGYQFLAFHAPNVLSLRRGSPPCLDLRPLTLRVLEGSTLDCHRTLCILPHFLEVCLVWFPEKKMLALCMHVCMCANDSWVPDHSSACDAFLQRFRPILRCLSGFFNHRWCFHILSQILSII